MGESKRKHKMTVEEAGRLGGEKTAETDGANSKAIGQQGGQRVRRLIRERKGSEQDLTVNS